MSKLKVAKKIEFFVNETIELKNGCIIQTYKFWTTNKKYLKYAYDHRFCLFQKLEELYKKDLQRNFKFLSREENEDNVVFRYAYDGSPFVKIPSKTINCEFYLPPYNGCKYCKKCKQDGDFLYCEEKKKHYDLTGIKNCQVFQSINEIIT